MFGLVIGVVGIQFAEDMWESSLSIGEKATALSLSILFCAGLGLMIGAGLDSWGPAP